MLSSTSALANSLVASCVARSSKGKSIANLVHMAEGEKIAGASALGGSLELAARGDLGGLPLVYLNQIGGQDELVFDGASFVLNAGRRMALKNQPKIVVSRIEKTPPTAADVVTARALAPLSQLLEWAHPHRTAPAICLFHKGKGWQVEVAEAKKDWDFPCQTFPSVTDRDAVLLRIGPTTSSGSAPAGPGP